MVKTPKRPGGGKRRRNPVARALAGGRFAKRVVKRKDQYRRRLKHRKAADRNRDGP